jgi:phospholipase/carboxylesterase
LWIVEAGGIVLSADGSRSVMVHSGREPVVAGARPADAAAVAVLVHGRDQDAGYMLEFFDRLGRSDVHCLLPEADGRTWYPGRFWAPAEENEPWLSGALSAIDRAVTAARNAASRPVLLIGFSQGGCLVAEYLARQGARGLAGAAVLTGALIGTGVAGRSMPSSLHGFPVVLTSGERDEWVPLGYVRETETVFRRAGADLRVEISDEPEHRIADEAVKAVGDLFERATGTG